MKKILMLMVGLMVSVSVLAQVDEAQTSVSELFRLGVKAFQEKNYAVAKKYMTKVINPTTDDQLRKEAEEFVKKCNQMITVVGGDSIKVTSTGLSFGADGDFNELKIVASSDWSIEQYPKDWIAIDVQEKDYLRLWACANKGSIERTGNISLRGGSEKVFVSLFQAKGNPQKGKVFFKTTPHNTYVEVSNGASGFSSNSILLDKGEYEVKISKEGYEDMDTLLTVETVDEDRIVNVELKPLFGKLYPIVSDDQGNSIQNLKCLINKTSVDLTDFANSHSYDDKEHVVFYGLYKDGTIPLNEGRYRIELSANGYSKVYETVEIKKGDTTTLDVKMKSIMGKLVVRDAQNAAGAIVKIDDLGLHGFVGDTLDVPVGKYQVEVKKDSYLLNAGALDVEIERNKTTSVDAHMTRMVDMLISVDGGNATLFVDNEKYRKLQEQYHLSLIEGESYDIRITQPGHLDYTRTVQVTEQDTLFNLTNLKLEEIHTFEIVSDEPGMMLHLWKDNSKSSVDYTNGFVTSDSREHPVTVEIPYGKYYMELIRSNTKRVTSDWKKIAWRGRVRFTEKRNSKFVQTWGTAKFSTLRFLNFEWTPLGNVEAITPAEMPMPFKINLLDIPLFRGLSTSLVECAAFYTNNMEMPVGLPEHRFIALMPAASPIFTNYDFRIGGGLFPYASICAVATYTYYLEIDKIGQKIAAKFDGSYGSEIDHFGGHEFFAGLEFGSRFRVINFYVRAGVQHIRGARYYNWYDSVSKTGIMPIRQTRGILTLGFNLGTLQSKGQNILMIF